MKLDQKSLNAALKQVMMPADEVIVCLIRTMTFGHKLGIPSRNIGKHLLNMLCEAFGTERTVVMAAYYPRFSQEGVFDLRKSPPSTGVVPAAAVESPDWKRTLTPTNSYVIRGPKTQDIFGLKCTTAWGEDGMLSWIINENALVILIGIPEANNGWLAVHSAEQKLRVPYRYFKRLSGTCFDNGRKLGTITEVLYVNPNTVELIQDHSSVTKLLRTQNREKAAADTNVSIRAAHCRDIAEAGEEIIGSNPYAFVVNSEDARAWVENGKQNEINSLANENRWPQ